MSYAPWLPARGVEGFPDGLQQRLDFGGPVGDIVVDATDFFAEMVLFLILEFSSAFRALPHMLSLPLVSRPIASAFGSPPRLCSDNR
jgi:hypothetical protein